MFASGICVGTVTQQHSQGYAEHKVPLCNCYQNFTAVMFTGTTITCLGTTSAENLRRSTQRQKVLKLQLRSRSEHCLTPIFCYSKKRLQLFTLALRYRVKQSNGHGKHRASYCGNAKELRDTFRKQFISSKSFRVAVFTAKVVFFPKTYYILYYQFPWKPSFLSK